MADRYRVVVSKVTKDNKEFAPRGMKYIVFIRDNKNPLASLWRFTKTKAEADELADGYRHQIKGVTLNPTLLILNPDEIESEADELVEDSESIFANLFDKMKDEISDKVGYDITGDPESEAFVDEMLAKLMDGITLKEVTG